MIILSKFIKINIQTIQFKILINQIITQQIESLKMSTTDNRVRKSSRQPVPNPIYQQGITQLKNQNTFRPKRKAKIQEQIVSYDQQKNSQMIYEQSYNNYSESKQQYLPCKLPDGTQLKVMFVLENKKEEKQKKKQKQPVNISVPTPKPVTVANNNNKKSTNLLSLFIQAIDNVEVAQNPSQQANFVPKINHVQSQKQKPIPVKQKRSKVQQQDFIKKVTVQKQNMVLSHSTLGQIKIPIDWEDNQIIQEQSNEVEQIRKKLQNFKNIKNISILMA